ncbi:MAG: class I SAM-dependent methyltransferase [Longimicrobiales bacterium]
MSFVRRVGRNLNARGVARLSHLFAKKSFRFFEKYLSLHVTPAHYYSPIPRTDELGPEVFEKVYADTGLDWNLDVQLAYLDGVFADYTDEYRPEPNPGLSLVDAFALYAMIRKWKPALMVEIGSGFSTQIALRALRKNREEGHPFRFVAIEPYPRAELHAIDDPDFELMAARVQDVDLAFFRDVDLLFIDSTHVSKIGSDVNYEILEIVPSLKPGAVIHWHDIVMPTNYWREWIRDGNQFWNESYLLHAFLLFNDAFEVLWAARYMHLTQGDALRARFPYVRDDHRLMSFWIRRTPEADASG